MAGSNPSLYKLVSRVYLPLLAMSRVVFTARTIWMPAHVAGKPSFPYCGGRPANLDARERG